MVSAPLTGPEVVSGEAGLAALAPAWRELVLQAGATPFCSPDWLLPWARAYASAGDAFVLAWRDPDGSLVAVMPLVRDRRRVLPLVEVAPWANRGTALRGMVDLVALPGREPGAGAALAAWLAGPSVRWDLVSALRLPAGSPTAGMLARIAAERGLAAASNTGAVRSDTFVLDLPAAGSGERVLGAKARHNLRTEARKFERQGGRYETLTAPADVAPAVRAIRRLVEARWGPGERTFRGDPAAERFLVDALEAFGGQGGLILDVARDESGIRAALVTLVSGRRAVALLIGVSDSEDVRRLALGKQLFAMSIDRCAERGAETYDFLWVGGYKEAFWGATARRMESIVIGRGLVGSLLVRRAAARASAAARKAAPAGGVG